ncbi:response regulator transcription factor [bacterium]|nr:response regulator transcription factor [bacterium]
MANESVLVVDDEANIVELITYNLENEGFKVYKAYNGKSALECIAQNNPDLVILDVMMPQMNGFDVVKQLRQEGNKIAIILATAKSEEIDKILGLELGADDYVPKPFSPRELIARVKAILRRTKAKKEEQDEICFGKLVINLVRHEVRKDGVLVELKPKEFELLKLMATNPGKVFSRDYLLEQLWGYDYMGDTRTVDVHMRRLRQKIEDEPSEPRQLKTVHGVGYKFHYDEDSASAVNGASDGTAADK